MARTAANRRKYFRIPAPIHCRPAGEDFFAPRLEPIDISLGGLRTYADEEYKVGCFVSLDIFLSGVAPVTLKGKIMWIKGLPKGAPARFDMGLAFVDLKPDAVNVLKHVFATEQGTESPRSSVLARRSGLRRPQPPPELTLDLTPTEAPVRRARPVSPMPSLSAPPQPSDSRAWLGRIPVVLFDSVRLLATKLDARAGFLVALIDGQTTVEALLDVSGMSFEETMALLESLKRRGIIALH